MINGLKPYPSYKDSGVVWLERVPKQWELRRLKAFVAQINEQTSSKTSNDVYVALEHVESWTGRVRPPVGDVTFDSQVKRFRRGDVLFGKLRPYLAKVTRLPVDGVCVGEFLVLRPRPCDVAPEFLEKILRSKTIIDTINSSTFGAKMPRADWGFIGSLLLAFPPLDEQAAIVRFLDHADARIRRYIRAKQKLIKLVEAEKQAIIQRAVTRGIDSTAPLQSSGVEWLGDVPKHWEVRRIKTLFCEKDQRNGDGNGLLLSLTRARGIIPQTEASNRIASAEDLSNYKVCRTGDLVMNRMQAWSGMFAVSPQEGVVSPDYSVFGVIGSLRAEFFEYLFKTPLLVDQFAQRSKGIGSGFNRLYTRDFGSVPVAVPPLPEQSRIVEFLHDATSGLSSIVDRAHHEIALLREYNICLIADAVTGKLDVREAAKALPQEAPEAERLDEIEDVPQDESVAEDMGLEAADVP